MTGNGDCDVYFDGDANEERCNAHDRAAVSCEIRKLKEALRGVAHLAHDSNGIPIDDLCWCPEPGPMDYPPEHTEECVAAHKMLLSRANSKGVDGHE